MRDPEIEVSRAVQYLINRPISRENIEFVLRNFKSVSLEDLKKRLFAGPYEAAEITQAFKSESNVYSDRLLEEWGKWLILIVGIQFERKRVTLIPLDHISSFNDDDPKN